MGQACSTVADDSSNVVWRAPTASWLFAAVAVVALGVLYFDALAQLVHQWDTREEYSHGYMLPFVSLFLVWQQKNVLAVMPFRGAWMGLWLLLLGILFYFLGTLSTVFLVVHYSLIIVLAGLVLSYTGWAAMRYLWAPLVFLVFMIPLPPFLHNQMSLGLQLISSEIGVAVIRLFGISVFLEGNVIDLGSYKLQVVDACSGLRYLFPLMSFGFLVAYFFKAPLWQRWFIFLSTIPITVLMNSFRIGIVGVLVEYFGIEHAEGFVHDFEGWIIFMACLAVLFFEVWLFTKLGGGSRSFWDRFNLDLPAPRPTMPETRSRSIPRPFAVAVAALVVAAVIGQAVEARSPSAPPRKSLTEFPSALNGWIGRSDSLDEGVLNALDFPDYYIGDFTGPNGETVNFYAAYYASQAAGDSAHSPRSCIPGGGWKIAQRERLTIAEASVGDEPLAVNRMHIQRGDERQLVYYWFQQRGRVLTNEYAVKWYLFWDAMTRNRTDGALVRLTTRIEPWETWADGDRRLKALLPKVTAELAWYVPD
jgi:exosortase D (VPLPA-CTERM-specific)